MKEYSTEINLFYKKSVSKLIRFILSHSNGENIYLIII